MCIADTTTRCHQKGERKQRWNHPRPKQTLQTDGTVDEREHRSNKGNEPAHDEKSRVVVAPLVRTGHVAPEGGPQLRRRNPGQIESFRRRGQAPSVLGIVVMIAACRVAGQVKLRPAQGIRAALHVARVEGIVAIDVGAVVEVEGMVGGPRRGDRHGSARPVFLVCRTVPAMTLIVGAGIKLVHGGS